MGLTATCAGDGLRAHGSRPLVACQCQKDWAPPHKFDENSSLTMLTLMSDKTYKKSPNMPQEQTPCDATVRGVVQRRAASHGIVLHFDVNCASCREYNLPPHTRTSISHHSGQHQFHTNNTSNVVDLDTRRTRPLGTHSSRTRSCQCHNGTPMPTYSNSFQHSSPVFLRLLCHLCVLENVHVGTHLSQ